MKSSKIHIFHRMMETFHYHNGNNFMCECERVCTCGVVALWFLGVWRERPLLEVKKAFPEVIVFPPPLSLSPKSMQLSDVSALGCWTHFSYKKYIRANESGLEKTATLARHTLCLTALWATWHYKTGDMLTSNR